MKIVNVHIPDNKSVVVGLCKIYGIGQTRAINICEALGLDPRTKVNALSIEQQSELNNYIEDNYSNSIEDNLRSQTHAAIKKKIAIRSWEGLRLMKNLPLKGRTRSNGKTAKRELKKIKI